MHKLLDHGVIEGWHDDLPAMGPLLETTREETFTEPVLEDPVVVGLLQELLGTAQSLDILGIAVHQVELSAHPEFSAMILQMGVDHFGGAAKGMRSHQFGQDMQMANEWQGRWSWPIAGKAIDPPLAFEDI